MGMHSQHGVVQLFFLFVGGGREDAETKVGAAHWGSPIRGSTNPTKQTSSLLSG